MASSSSSLLLKDLVKGKIYRVTETVPSDSPGQSPTVAIYRGMFGVMYSAQFVLGDSLVSNRFITAIEEIDPSKSDAITAVKFILSDDLTLDQILTRTKIDPFDIIVECSRRIYDLDVKNRRDADSMLLVTTLCSANSRLRSGTMTGLEVDGGAKRQRRRQTQKQRRKLLRNRRTQSRKQY